MKIKKRLLILLSCAALLAMPIQAFASFSVQYRNGKFSYEGEHEAAYVKLSIAPRAVELSALSDEEINGRTDVFIASVPTNPGGAFSEEGIGLPGLPENTYIATANSQHCCEKRIFAKSDAATLATVASAFLSSDDPYSLLDNNLSKLGFDREVFKKHGAAIVKLLTGYMKDSPQKLTLDQLYLLSENIMLVKDGSLSFGDMLMLCGDFTGIDYEKEYLSCSAAVLTALENMAVKQDYSGKSFSEAYHEALLLAQANVLKSDMSQVVLAYCEKEGVDLSGYRSLSSYKQSLVFGDMAELAPFDSVKKLLAAFDAAVKERSKDNGGGGGGTPTSGNRGGAAQNAYSVIDNTEPPPQTAFSDIKGHWAETAIQEMAKNGIVNGYTDGGFHPEADVTRAEFVKMLVEMLGVSPSGGEGFADVAADSWYRPYVYAAAGLGLVKGVTEKEFAPNRQITRESVAVILHRVLTGRGMTFSSGQDFADANQISSYAEEAVSLLAGAGIVKGADGYFRPKDALSRGEAAALLYRISSFLTDKEENG